LLQFAIFEVLFAITAAILSGFFCLKESMHIVDVLYCGFFILKALCPRSDIATLLNDESPANLNSARPDSVTVICRFQ